MKIEIHESFPLLNIARVNPAAFNSSVVQCSVDATKGSEIVAVTNGYGSTAEIARANAYRELCSALADKLSANSSA